MLLVLAGLACRGTTAPTTASVQFTLDAPFCGGNSSYSFTLQIDQRVVGTEMLKDRQTSQAYSTSSGQHVIGARIGTTVIFTPDTMVVLKGGETFTRVLPFYCS